MKPDTVQLEIDSLAAGGDGVGRLGGVACFVPFTAPGDSIAARVVKKARGFLRAELVEVLRAGPSRRASPCALFGRCGGCAWLHVEETAQRTAKAAFIERAVRRDGIVVHPSPLSLGYRRLARFHFEPGRRGVAPSLGFVPVAGRGVVDVARCPVVDPAIERALTPVREQLLAAVAHPVEVRLLAAREGVSAAVASGAPLPIEFYRAAEALVPGRLAAVTAEADGFESRVAGPALVSVGGGDGGDIAVPSSSFGQANAEVNRALGEAVAGFAAAVGAKRGVELFAGAGNLSVALAPHIGSLATAELDARAVAAARDNLAGRGLASVAAHAGDAVAMYERLGAKADLVVLDPPRTGAAELARRIARNAHRAVIYVSCDPATLSRDLGILAEGGYRVRDAVGFDMFPQTAHVESAVLLGRP